MTDDPWQNDAERRVRERNPRRGEGSSSAPPPRPPPAEPKGQARLAAAYNNPRRLSDTRRRQLEAKADALDHPGTPELAALAARVEDDPSFWNELSADQKLQLGLLQASHGTQHELNVNDDDPTAA